MKLQVQRNVGDPAISRTIVDLDTDNHDHVAYICDRDLLEEERRLAHLFAASPNLLAKCGMALDVLLSYGFGESSHPVMALRSAIAEAKGE